MAGFATAADVRWIFVNSDILLAADFVHHLLHAPATLRDFQLPRVPSLVPDLLATTVLSVVLPGWRVVSLAYAALSAGALVLLGGAVTAGLSGRSWGRALAAFGSLATLAMLVDLLFDHAWGAFTLVLFPAIHSGSLLCTFAGLLLVRRFTLRPGAGLALLLAGLCGLATLSDRLFVLAFVVPALAGTLAVRTGRPDWRLAGLVAGAVAAGCLAGTWADQLLFAPGVLLRQPDIPIDPATIRARLPALLHEPSLYLQAGFAALTVLLPAGWAAREPGPRFWWAASACGSVALLAVLPAIYIDWSSTRYMQPVWWWAIVAGAATLLRLPGGLPGAVAGSAVAASAALLTRDDLFALHAVTRWRPPELACLRPLQAAGSIHAGLAAYWVARPLAAGSDWTLPVVQVLGDGGPQFWGNDLAAYRRGSPAFDFIVMDRLDPGPVRTRFGPPTRAMPCGGGEVWLYPDDGRLGARLAAPAPPSGMLETAAAFLPGRLSTRAGPLPPDGTVPQVAEPGIASWGPYAPLAPGRWRAVLRYSFAGTPVPHGWEVTAGAVGPVLASGTLEPGEDRIATLAFDVPAGAHLVEVRTVASPGDRLVLPGLALCPAAMPEPDCVRITPGG